MPAIDLIFSTLPLFDPPEDPKDGICCVTGKHEKTIKRKHAIKNSFTNSDLLRAPMSDRVGIPAWRVLTYSEPHHDPTKKRNLCPLRQSHWVCDGKTIEYIDRQKVREKVLGGVNADKWCGYVTTSYKKHGCLMAPVNTKGKQVWLFETRLVDCSSRSAVLDIWSRLREAQDSGIPRPLIERLDISPGYIGKIGWRVWRDFEAWANPRMLSPLYQFLTYLLPSKEELKCKSE